MLRRIAGAAIRTYDIRGAFGADVHADGAYALGLAYATRARAAGLGHVGVGRDGRTSSPELERGLVAGLSDGGLDVARVGLGPTPMLSFAVRRLALDGAIMVTGARHAPGENGFKVLLGDAPLHGEALRELVAAPARATGGGEAHHAPVLETYAASLAAAGSAMPALRVVWDCGHGAAGPVVERLVAKLPGQHVICNRVVDGRFPARSPDLSADSLRMLAAAVADEGADVGLAFDGDGGGLAVADAGGLKSKVGVGPRIWAADWTADTFCAALSHLCALGR